MTSKVLIAGDSFAADWTVKYPDQSGWPNLLANQYHVDNMAQAGCSEYRIYQQLVASNLKDYDHVIVSHTSPYRIYTEYNPVRKDDLLHHHCDLLYSDVKNLTKDYKEYAGVSTYFEQFFSLEYAEFCYTLIREQIDKLLYKVNAIQIAHMPVPGILDVNFSNEFKNNPGLVNHYSKVGNNNVYRILLDKLQSS